MPEADVIIVTYDDTCLRAPPPLRIVRGEHPDVFDGYVDWAGGLSVGETKRLFPIDGYVTMNDDRSLTIRRPGPGPEYPPAINTIRPNDAGYGEIIARLGSLVSGQTRILTQPTPDE